MTRLHADELSVDDGVVHDLLRRDFPQHSSAPLTRVDRSGSSNALFRLGSDLLVRLPRQPGGGSGIEKEVRWLPYVAPRVYHADLRWYRGLPLTDLDEDFRASVEECRALRVELDLDAALGVWDDAVGARIIEYVGELVPR